MGPQIQPLFCEPRQRGIRLLCQCRGKIPCPHHIDIVFRAAHIGHPFQIFRPECIIQIIAHQHLHAIAHGVHLARIQPAANGHQQLLLVLRKHFGAEAVAGGPVVDVGQERFRFSQRPVVVPDKFDQKRVEVVLFVVSMRQGL